MAEIKASANFSSVVQELSKVTTAYTEYNKKAGKAITTNKILITSFKDLNSVLKITTDLINSTSAPLRTYTKNFDQSTQSIRGAKTATSGLASENRNFVITVQKTKKDLEATSIALLDVQEKYRTGINTLVKSRDALTAWGKQAIKNVGVIERNGKTVLTFNNKIRSTTKDVLKLSKTLVELRAKGNVGRSFTNSANKLRVMRQENEKLNRTLRDGLGPMAQISKATGKYGSRTGSASKQIGKTATAVTRLTLSMQTFARLGLFSLASRSISAFTSGLSQASSEAVDFEKKISAIRTISTDNQLSFEAWAGGIREVADEFNIPLLEATSSVYTSISNQVVKGAEAFDFLRVNANLAITAQGSISDAISATSSIIKSYNLDVSDANEISAKLFKTAELGRVPLASIGETIGTVTVIASRAGVSFDEVSASLATMTVQGIKPVKAITFLRNIILKILKPTEAMKDAVEQMGFASAESAVRTLGLGKFLEELRKTTKGTASELAQLLGSVRAMQAGFALSGTSLEQYEQNLVKIGNATKDFDERIQIAKESVGFNFQKELNQASSAMTNLGRQINETALRVIKGFGGLKNIIETIATLIKGGLLFGAIALLGKGLVALRLNLKITATSFITLGNATKFTSRGMQRLGLAAIKLGRSLKTAFASFAPFLAIEAAFLIGDAITNNIQKNADLQIKSQRAIEKALNNSLKNRERALQRFVQSSKKIRDKGVIDSILSNNKRIKSLKDSLKEGSKAFDEFSKNSIASAKLALGVIKTQEDALNKTLKSTTSILAEIKKGRDKLDDSIFGKGFSNLGNIPNLQKELDKALISDSAENIKKSFSALKTSIETAIAGSDDKSFISAMQERLRLLFDTVEARTKKINDKAVKNQERIVRKREELEDKLRRRTEAKDLVGRSSPTQILKETSAEGVTISGEAILGNLTEALDIAPLLDKPKIQKKIDDFNELFTRRLLQLSNEELDKSRVDAVDKIKKLIDSIFERSGREIKTNALGKALNKEIGNLLSAGRISGEGINASDKDKAIFKFVDKKDIDVLIRIRKELQKGASINDEDLKTLRRIVKERGKLEEGNKIRATNASFSNSLDRERFNKSLKNLKDLSVQSGKFSFLGTLTTASALVKKLDELLERQEKLTGESRRKIVTDKEKLKLSNESIKKANEELEILKETTKKQKEINAIIKTQVEDANKKEAPKDSATKAFEERAKGSNIEKEKTIQKKVTSEGTIDGLTLIQQTLTNFWAKIIKNATIKATKEVGVGVGGASSGTDTTIPKPIPVKIETEKLGLFKEAGEKEKKAQIRALTTRQRQELELANLEKDILKDQKEGKDVLFKQGRVTTLKAKIKELPKDETRFDTFVKENATLTSRVEGVGNSLLSLDAVISGASDKIDLSGLSAFGAGIGAAAGAVQFFANQLLGGKKKGLTNRQRNSALLQGGIGGATAGASFGPWGAAIGAVAGAGIAYYQTRQKGGLIYRAGGGGVPSPSKGTDTVPAMLTQGEFVMNRGSTDKFYSQLKAMNSMTYRADGGRVSNSSVTVGDINVSASQNSRGSGVDTVQIGNQIRRDIRAGKLGSFS